MATTTGHKTITFTTSPTSQHVVLARVSSATPHQASPRRSHAAARETHAPSVEVENAIFSYIQAIRTLGRMEVNISEIAKALSLPTEVVSLAASKLKHKGVLPGK